MDSRSRLDYALFQLTPTRTRCDLVICAGDCKEKIASGLLAPFIAHLNFAKDESSKGGYSITLSANSPSASWFTKSTLERFVRFVSTPEVLERFITIEREISNIELSLDVKTPSDSQSAYKYEGDKDDAVPEEEDSKVHLQRVLENRKKALQKEQAMVYARALVAGFETNNLEDLISFSDAFGSPRLREACLNFMELCNTKSNDRVWMDEVAAMQAYSHSQYSYIEDDPNQELKVNVQNGNFATKKVNNAVDMHTYQNNPMFNLPYQGYPFPPMVIPPYYQQNLPLQDFQNRRNHSQNKDLQDGYFDSSDASSESETKSSKKVVIRNINYITSERNGEKEQEYNDNFTCEDRKEGENVTQQWNIFQNLLMKDADEKDSKVVSKSSGRHKEQDLFLKSLQDKDIHEKSKDIFEDHFQSKESTKDVLVDDPLAVQDRSLNRTFETHLRTQDILMVSDNLTTKDSYSPSDLYMVLERDTSGQKSNATWDPEMELGNNDVKIIKPDSVVNKKSTLYGKQRKSSTIETKSKSLSERKSKTDFVSRNKKVIPKGKSDKEEEKRKRIEELLTQRQKRIAERSAFNNKSKSQLASRDMKKSNKPVMRSSTINRLSTARVVNPKVVSNESKSVYKPMKVTTKKISESKPSKMVTKKIVESKPSTVVTKKIIESKPTKLANKKIDESKPTKMTTKKISELKPTKVANKKIDGSKSSKMVTKKIDESKSLKTATKKNVESKPSKLATKNIVSKNSNETKKIANINNVKEIPITPPKSENMKHVINETPPSVIQEDVSHSLNNGGSSRKGLHTVTFKINEDNGVNENSNVKISHGISMINSPERNISRKKWSGFETSGKALNGLKKLLSFGRRR